jgi:hypothetical protein
MGAIDTGLTLGQQVEAIYVGYYGRAADSGGFTFWVGQFNQAEDVLGQSADVALTNVADSFAPNPITSQPETAAQYPELAQLTPPLSASSPADVAAVTNFVDAVYMNVFNRLPAAGDTYWIDHILSNSTPLGAAVLGIENGAIGVDAMTLLNKIAVADSFTSQTSAAGLGQVPIPTSYLQEAHTVVAATTSDPGTVTAQETAITTYVTGATMAPTVPLTTGMDTITAPADSNVAISGIVDNHFPNQSTLQVGDTINPGGTMNSLAITYIGTAAGAINNSDVPVLNNVQTLTVTNNGAPVVANLTGIGPSLTSVGITAGNALDTTTFTGFSGTQVTNFTMTNLTAGTQALVISPNTGLNTAGVASGAATVAITDATQGPGAAAAPILAFKNSSAVDGYSSITLNSNGSTANELSALFQLGGVDLVTLTVNGAEALKIDAPVTFGGGVVSNVQAAMDQGGISIDLSFNSGKTTFVGGSGVDSLTIEDSQLVANATALNGGAGTDNTLTVKGFANTAADYTAMAAVTGFQIFGIATGAETINAGTGGLNGAFLHFAFSDAAGGDHITAMGSNSIDSIVDMLATNAAADTLAPAVGSAPLDLNIGASSSAGIVAKDILTGWSSVDLTSNGSAANTATLLLSNSASLTVGAGGGDPLTLKLFTGPGNGVLVDASAFTGTLVVNDTGHNDTINTGSGAATINENVATLNDSITYLSGHTTVDTLVSAETNNSASAVIENITNFALGQDFLENLVGPLVQGGPGDLATTNAGTGLATGFGTSATFITAAEATATAAPGHAVAEIIGSNTWVAEFYAAGAGHAHIVELMGVSNVTAIGGTGAGHILIA